MNEQDPRVQTAVSELANAIQVAAPAAARIRHLLDMQTQDADALKAALDRAVRAVKELQPVNGREGA
jgi:hypothetical protein